MARPKSKQAPLFGQRLAKYRKMRGFTQEELAKRLGVSQKTIDQYECRTSNPTAKFLIKASKELNISVDELLGLKSLSLKPGPISKLEKQLEDLRKLPASKQKLISDMIGTLAKASLASSEN